MTHRNKPLYAFHDPGFTRPHDSVFLYSVEDACRAFRVARITLYGWIKTRRVPPPTSVVMKSMRQVASYQFDDAWMQAVEELLIPWPDRPVGLSPFKDPDRRFE